jgi:F-type H+-transporting ATPase subunit delta
MGTREGLPMSRTKQARRDAKQLYRLCLVNGLLDEGRVRDVVRRVSESKNRNRLKCLGQFQRLVRLEYARHAATVENAVSLPSGLQASIEARLASIYGPGLNITFLHDPGLIGGIRIKVGSDVYDNSVMARLAALQARF